nr:phage tail sheath family protein [uncultured Caproiciproducens sp.]
MAGGNWTTQNKVLPGVYTNYVGSGANPSVTGDSGIVGLPVVFPWLKEKTLILLTKEDAEKLAADFGSDAMLVTEAMKNASQVYLFRLNAGVKASATIGNLTCTALYSGIHGNRLSVSIENTVGQTGKFDVVTWLDTSEIGRQTVADIAGLSDNNWITFFKAAQDVTLAVNAGTLLKNGADGTVTSADYAAFLSAIELQTVNAVACPCNDADVKALFVAFGKRMIQEEGKYIQVAVPNTLADYEGVLSIKNGVTLENGTHVTNVMATAYIAGATAACPLTESLTNAKYIGAVDVDERYSIPQQTEYAKSGQIVFIPSPVGGNSVLIQKDINTLTSFTTEHTYAMSKNKIIRILFSICTEINNRGTLYYSGKVANNQDGRNLFQANILSYFRSLESNGVVRDVVPEDIVVKQGNLIDAMVVSYAVRPVDVIETIYNTITIEG